MILTSAEETNFYKPLKRYKMKKITWLIIENGKWKSWSIDSNFDIYKYIFVIGASILNYNYFLPLK